MITLYTAIGTYKLNRNGYPSVVSGEREYSLDTFELIMWSVLSYRISSYDELKDMFCEKVQELHITNERGFDHYLSRMLSRNLIASGKNSDGVEALYSLLGRLHIEILMAIGYMVESFKEPDAIPFSIPTIPLKNG